MSKKSHLVIGAGIGAVALGGALYLLWKYSEEEEESGKVLRSKQVTIQVKIPCDQVGLVIGRGGETIKEIQRKTSTRIDFKDAGPQENYRLAIIRGAPSEAQLAEILIYQILNSQPRLETMHMTVPSSSVGRIIGRNGDTIREIQQSSKCKVEVERGHPGSEYGAPKKITLRGTSAQIAHAKTMIEEKVMEDKFLKRKMESSACERSPRIQTVAPLFLTTENSNGENKSDTSEIEDLTRPSIETLEPSSGGGDEIIEVYVSSIADPTTFYVQKVGPRSIALDKLVEEMTAYFELESNRKKLKPSEVKVGDLVAARFSTDNNWYRARIVDISYDDYDEDETEIDIDFVDFGDWQRKRINDIAELESRFLKLNLQAIECSMANIKPANGREWTTEAADDFESLSHAAQWKVVLAKLIKYESKKSENSGLETKPCLELIDASSNQDINIGAELVRLGHAVFTDNSGSLQSPIVETSTPVISPSAQCPEESADQTIQ